MVWNTWWPFQAAGLGWLDGCLRQGKGLFWILEPAQQENHAGNSSLDWFKGKFDLNPQYISWLKHVKTVKTIVSG